MTLHWRIQRQRIPLLVIVISGIEFAEDAHQRHRGIVIRIGEAISYSRKTVRARIQGARLVGQAGGVQSRRIRDSRAERAQEILSRIADETQIGSELKRVATPNP